MRFLFIVLALLLTGCLVGCQEPINSPHLAGLAADKVLFSAFSERPKHLDPARAYSENEMAYLGQIYEPPLQYNYLKRPFTLEPLTLSAMPEVAFYDAQGRVLPADAPAVRVTTSVYTVRLKAGIRYQPHPALAPDRVLTADDYIYQIKRLADPRVSSPIASLMGEYIIGLNDLGVAIEQKLKRGVAVDLVQEPLSGVERVDALTWRIRIKGKYPQFLYWLAMPFFAPMPEEADRYYGTALMRAANLTLDSQPVGTGAFYMAENDPNRVMILRRNPNYHADYYPTTGEPNDAAAGLLRDAGRRLPLLDAAVYSLEKEDIPYWNKFLQGYYDTSGIASDTFDQAIRIGPDGRPDLSPEMRARDIQLATTNRTSIWYLGFNWLDPVLGGVHDPERARKLRQAVSIALDWDEFISIFLNGRGLPGHGPIPPGIFGFKEGAINAVVYQPDGRRRALAEARRLLAEAGYPHGRDARTGAPLTLYFDTMASGPESKARLDWYRKQFARLDIQLVVRSTDYNRFQDKMRKGNAQIFEWGWNADYPDPENFLFLLYGPNRKQGKNGENAANYSNPEFDRLFTEMKSMDNGPARQAVIDRMVQIVRVDAPWVFAYTPKAFGLRHGWLANAKPNPMAHNTLKYLRVDPVVRQAYQRHWNRPLLWPVGVGVLLLIAMVYPAWRLWRRRLRMTAVEGR
ncbi:MAG: peptide ABC transporter substrate-binding protein [Betaproteobacteria bacterium]|nr:MAG: peptide ABC transporter substrate-binding protein [Betaproteobacteria bacterium]